jgi:hypothetical protein
MIRPFLCCAFVAGAGAVDSDRAGVKSLSLPESVLQDPHTGAIYCSSIGGKEPTPEAVTAKDKDGYISLLGPDGQVRVMQFLPRKGDPPLNGPKGLALIGTTLWVADIDRVVGFDLSTKTEVSAIDLSPYKVSFANDLLPIDDRLLCSDTTSGQILCIDPRTPKPLIDTVATVDGANGLAFDRSRPGQLALLVAQYPFTPNTVGGIQRLAFALDEQGHVSVGDAQALAFPGGQWDGLAVTRGGTVYASDWKSGAIWELKPGAAQATKLDGADGFKGPADFCLLADETAILCPDLVKQEVRVIKLPQ